ncbi:ABC transporter [Clostridia bacterium]|nr:ABC transporter [Clostridia bacterium]
MIIINLYEKIVRNRFLFEELVKRDFNKRYKRTVLGILWSIISPLILLLVLATVFGTFFKHSTPHYIPYLFCGNLVFSYYAESTSMGMTALVDNAAIFSKINVPKYMFLLTKNVSSLINFGITLILLFIFVAANHIDFTWKFLLLVYPVVCLVVFNLGVGLILSAMYVFFRDTKYLYDIFKTMLMYFSAIFYTITSYPENLQKLFLLNPIYVYITYFRKIIINDAVPSLGFHLLAFGYAAVALLIGALIYKKQNFKFLYYI